MWMHYTQPNFVLLSGRKGLMNFYRYVYYNCTAINKDFRPVTPKELGAWND